MKIKLSILDQMPVRTGSDARTTLGESIELVKTAEALGYTRYWISEHHNTSTIAGAAPEVILSRLGAETKSIRIGSGGIMLPNHSALKVAENFRMLEALYPNRIDLGIGRAPGGDRLTAALLNPSNKFDPREYIEQIVALRAYLTDDSTPGTVHEKVKAIPRIDTVPEMWMLTSSGESAYLAAHFGMSVSFAAFINPVGGGDAIRAYRQMFKAGERNQPRTSVGIFAFCSESEEKVTRAQALMDYRLISFTKGNIDESPTYEAIRHYQYTEAEWRQVLFNRQRMIIGTPDVVQGKVLQLAADHDTDEVVVATFAETHDDRVQSYTWLAEMIRSGRDSHTAASVSENDRI